MAQQYTQRFLMWPEVFLLAQQFDNIINKYYNDKMLKKATI